MAYADSNLLQALPSIWAKASDTSGTQLNISPDNYLKLIEACPILQGRVEILKRVHDEAEVMETKEQLLIDYQQMVESECIDNRCNSQRMFNLATKAYLGVIGADFVAVTTDGNCMQVAIRAVTHNDHWIDRLVDRKEVRSALCGCANSLIDRKVEVFSPTIWKRALEELGFCEVSDPSKDNLVVYTECWRSKDVQQAVHWGIVKSVDDRGVPIIRSKAAGQVCDHEVHMLPVHYFSMATHGCNVHFFRAPLSPVRHSNARIVMDMCSHWFHDMTLDFMQNRKLAALDTNIAKLEQDISKAIEDDDNPKRIALQKKLGRVQQISMMSETACEPLLFQGARVITNCDLVTQNNELVPKSALGIVMTVELNGDVCIEFVHGDCTLLGKIVLLDRERLDAVDLSARGNSQEVLFL